MMRKITAGILLCCMFLGMAAVLSSCGSEGNTLTIGTTSPLTGDFEPWWTNAAGDREVATLINGCATVVKDENGRFIPNPQVITDLKEETNADGTKTYTLTFAEDLRFSDGTVITAAHYAASVLLFSSPVIVECGATGAAGTPFVGWEAYRRGETDTFSGVRLLSPNMLSLTVSAENATHYLGIYPLLLYPLPMHVWLPSGISVTDSGAGAVLHGDFSAETCRETIESARRDVTDRVSAGAFRLVSYDAEKRQAVLMRNEYFKGAYDGTLPMLDSIVYMTVEAETMFSRLKDGSVDVIHGISGAAAIGEALTMEESGKYKTVRYDENGCDTLLFRCDSGVTQYEDVRRAIAHLIDREALADAILADYGDVVYAPYSSALRIYERIEEYAEEYLNEYEYSPESAVGYFVRAGFVLGKDGEPYESGVRYKEISASEADAFPRSVEVGERYLVPLVIDWCTFEESAVAPQLLRFLGDSAEIASSGIVFEQTVLPYEEYQQYLSRQKRGPYSMFDTFYPFGVAYDVAGMYTDDPMRILAGENPSGIIDRKLSDAATDLTSGVSPGDEHAYFAAFGEFAYLHNTLLPELPLFSSVCFDIVSARIDGYEAGPGTTVMESVLRCSVEK